MNSNLMEKAIFTMQMNQDQPKHTFTRTFGIMGEMTGEAASEDKCTTWSKRMPLLVWDDVNFSLCGDFSSEKACEITITEYVATKGHETRIVEAIKNHKYVQMFAQAGVDVLASIGKVNIDLELNDLSWGTCVKGMYSTQDAMVDFVVKNGNLVQLGIYIYCNAPDAEQA